MVRLTAWSVEVALVLRWKKVEPGLGSVVQGQGPPRSLQDRKTTGTSKCRGWGLPAPICLSWVLGVTQITRVHDKDLHTLSPLVSLKREVFKGKMRVEQDNLKPQAEVQVTDESGPCP